MLPDETVPAGLAEVLKACRSCFTARSFPVFCLLAVGMIAQVGPSTVTGILVGAGMQRRVGHNRVAAAVERTVPFGMLVMTIVHLWYALSGHDATDAAAHRAARPWYTSKTEPTFSDMLVKLRRTIIKARFSAISAGKQPLAQIDHDALTWSLTAA